MYVVTRPPRAGLSSQSGSRPVFVVGALPSAASQPSCRVTSGQRRRSRVHAADVFVLGPDRHQGVEIGLRKGLVEGARTVFGRGEKGLGFHVPIVVKPVTAGIVARRQPEGRVAS